MKQRWYDADPTLSMAISLLHNASSLHQEMAARYLFKLIEARGILDSEALQTKQDRIRFIFPSFRRSSFEIHARQLIELLKHMDPPDQRDMAVALINYMYVLDGGYTDFPLPGETETMEQFLSHEIS